MPRSANVCPRNRVRYSRCCADHRFDRGLWRSFEDPLEDEEICIFVLEAERQVISEAVARPVSLVEDSPHPIPPAAAADMLFSHAARATDGCGDQELMRDGCRAHEADVRRDGLLLKRDRQRRLQLHCRNIVTIIENIIISLNSIEII